jgi:site-specific DNA recombinase
MTAAVLYARVSSREQEREGYSIPAQRKLLAGYARERKLEVAREFVDVESAKNPGRKQFGEMLRFLERSPQSRIVLVEKTDRLYRNRTDSLAFEELIEKRGVEVHLVKEGRVIGKNSRSQDKFMHDIHVAVAKNYSENLREEVKKGMREKAEQGTFPGHAPFGYRNDKETRTIAVDSGKSEIVKLLFELYATGNFSLTTLRSRILQETGIPINRAYLEKILKSRFYLGFFLWQDTEYKGSHSPLVSLSVFEQVQAVFAGRHKARKRKHDFAFGGLLRCAKDGCTVTAELHKQKHVYYRCSKGRGPCDTPYMREADLSDRLGTLLDGIYVPEGIANEIVRSIQGSTEQSEQKRIQELAGIKQRLAALRTRLDRMYEDKLDGKIDEELWTRKMNETREQERVLQAAAERVSNPITPEHALTVERIFELAQKARFLYLTRNPHERAHLLRMVLLNCATDGVSLTPTYRKPFDMIFERAKKEEWSGREDLNLRPPGPETVAHSLSHWFA